MNHNEGFQHYPTQEEVDAWIEEIWQTADDTSCEVEVLPEHGFTYNLGLWQGQHEFRYVKYTPKGCEPFYGYWQPAHSRPAPLLVHVPGYGAEMSAHPELVAEGFHVLHVSPLGYTTPTGLNKSLMVDGVWPVLPETAAGHGGGGYREWLLHVILAVRWAMSLPEVIPDRVSFFGSSQGGGGSLLLGSIFKDRGIRSVAADVPFLTNFPLAGWRGAYALAKKAYEEAADPAAVWRRLGYIDTVSHAHRLQVPVLLTAGSVDGVCPPDTIESLFGRLPGTRSYTYIHNTGHRYTREFLMLASSWFRLHA